MKNEGDPQLKGRVRRRLLQMGAAAAGLAANAAWMPARGAGRWLLAGTGTDTHQGSNARRVATPTPFDGQFYWPDDPNYDIARKVYDTRIDKHPALICECAS